MLNFYKSPSVLKWVISETNENWIFKIFLRQYSYGFIYSDTPSSFSSRYFR